MAASAIAAPAAQAVSGVLGGTINSAFGDGTLLQKTADGIVRGVVGQGVRMLVTRQGKMDYASIAADAFGNALGSSLAEAQTTRDKSVTQQIAEGTDAERRVAKILATNPELAKELEADGLNSLATAGGSGDEVKRPRWQPTSAAQRSAYANVLSQLNSQPEALEKASNVAMLVAIKERMDSLRADIVTNRALYLENNPDALRQMESFGPAFDRALLAKDVYFDRSIPELMPQGVSRVVGDAALGQYGLTTAALSGRDAPGYFAALYTSTDDIGTTRLIYANRGTDDMGGDVIANLQQGRGKETPQYKQAIDNARALKENGFDVEFVGHSLGGGLAAAQALVTKSKATVFNAAGVHPNTIQRWGADFSRASELITAYNLNGDALNFVQDGGKLVLAEAARKGLPFFGRAVGGPVGGLVGTAVGEWTAQELANMPFVRGNRYAFPASNAPVQVGGTFVYGGTFTNDQTYKLPAMVQQHFMDTMIYSMAARVDSLKWGK